MAIQLNENIRIVSPNPIDYRYLSPVVVSGKQVSYTSVAQANSLLNIAQDRHIGLTININGVDYWYKNGVTDVDLIEKIYGSDIPVGLLLTGATNLGFFSGKTGIQTLEIFTSLSTYGGDYNSLYNYYYRDSAGIIRIGTPSDGINKRGYVKTTIPKRSLVWNERTASSEQVGWILVDVDVSENIGVFTNGIKYYPPISAYANTSWVIGFISNGSNMSVDVVGDLDSGSDLVIGGPVYSHIDNNIINLRTLKSKNDNTLKITNDDYFVYFSGSSGTGSNLGTGVSVFTGVTNNNFEFRTIRGSGDTTISLSPNGEEIIINSSGGQTYVEGFGIDITGNVIGVEDGLFVAATTYNTYVNAVQPIIDRAITGATNGLTKVPNTPTGKVIRLGGSLTQNTEITGTIYDFTLSTKNINLISAESINIIDGTGVGGINIESDGGIISLVGNNISQIPITKIEIGENALKITDSRSGSNQKGIQYDACYHSNYDNRSLVDKEYVDTLITGGTGAVTGATNVGIGSEVFKQLNSEREFEYRRITGSGDTTVTQSGDTIVVHSVASGTTFTADIVVSIEAGKTFGRYVNGETIPASGKTPTEVILMALQEPLEPTINLSSAGNSVVFGDTTKTVNLYFDYIINSMGASVASVLLEYRRGGAWFTLSTDTGATTYLNHTFDDSGDRFNITLIEYRYTVVDSIGATGVTTHNVQPQQYGVPTYSPTYSAPSLYGYETETVREKGNVYSNISGNIASNRSLVNIIGYDVQRCVNSGSWSTLYSCTGINVQNTSIASCLDTTALSSADSVGYRVRVCDQWCTTTPNASSTYTINLRLASYHGYNSNNSLSNAQVLALGNQCLSTTKNRTITYTSPLTDYTFYIYPQSFGVLSSAIMDGASPVLGGFSYSSGNTVTNNYGENGTYLIYVTNATNAFTNNEIAFS